MAVHWKDSNRTIHCDGIIGDGYALCGLSLNGVNDDEAWTETYEGIDCSQCMAVLKFCWTVRRGELKMPHELRAKYGTAR